MRNVVGVQVVERFCNLQRLCEHAGSESLLGQHSFAGCNTIGTRRRQPQLSTHRVTRQLTSNAIPAQQLHSVLSPHLKCNPAAVFVPAKHPLPGGALQLQHGPQVPPCRQERWRRGRQLPFTRPRSSLSIMKAAWQRPLSRVPRATTQAPCSRPAAAPTFTQLGKQHAPPLVDAAAVERYDIGVPQVAQLRGVPSGRTGSAQRMLLSATQPLAIVPSKASLVAPFGA